MFDLARLPRSAFLPALQANLQRRTTPKKLYLHFLAAVRTYLGADAAWLLRGIHDDGRVDQRYVHGRGGLCTDDLSLAFAAQQAPTLPDSVLLAPLRVRGTMVAVIGAARDGRAFNLGDGHELTRLGAVLAVELTRRQDERLDRVLERLKEKVIQELRPQDLAYQILSGLHELVQFDHSAALLEFDPGTRMLRVQAEKIVWTKSKSAFIGHEIGLGRQALAALTTRAEPRVLSGAAAAAGIDGDRVLLEVLSYHQEHGLPAATSLIAAPLLFDSELLGVLKIAGRQRRAFDPHDLDVVARFLPVAAIALHNAMVTVDLEHQVVDAELRAGLATLARAVAHDVNNAIGAVLPLAQQMRAELGEGCADPHDLVEDLDAIIDKTRLCKRIFSNMLRTGIRRSGTGPIHLNQVVQQMLPMLEATIGRRPITLQAELAAQLPVIACSKHELEHVVWNLVSNAIDAFEPGDGPGLAISQPGRIELITERFAETSRDRAPGVRLEVRDNGPGMTADLLAKVQEPFFTTKIDGTGLGLPICRSLVWQMGGALTVHSQLGQGTSVVVELPAAEYPAAVLPAAVLE